MTPGSGQGDARNPHQECGSTQGKVTFVAIRAINIVKNFKVIIRYWDLSTKLDNYNYNSVSLILKPEVERFPFSSSICFSPSKMFPTVG